MAPIPPEDPDPGFAAALAARHLALTGRAILGWTDPCPIVAHGTGPDPVFRWANPAALALWETDWTTFTCLPSRLSAEEDPLVQSDRSRHLAEAARQGFVENYQGIRRSLKGRRFRITATLWTLPGLGQAARLTAIDRLD